MFLLFFLTQAKTTAAARSNKKTPVTKMADHGEIVSNEETCTYLWIFQLHQGPIAPSYTNPNAGGGGLRGLSCVHHVTWSPNKLWRSTSIFNLCFQPTLRSSPPLRPTLGSAVPIRFRSRRGKMWAFRISLHTEKNVSETGAPHPAFVRSPLERLSRGGQGISLHNSSVSTPGSCSNL